MSSTMSLNTRVHIVSKSGKKETITVRELLTRGTGTAFETFQMLDEYDDLAMAYDAEQRIEANEKDREDHLPLGAHLLPEDYQDFLYGWNKHITATTGWWNGQERADFWKANPEHKAEFASENRRFMQLYPEEVKAVKAYQATHSVEDSEDDEQALESSAQHDQLQSLEIDQLPSLPPSPVAPPEPEQSDELEQMKAMALDIIGHHDYQLGCGDHIIHAFCNDYLIPYLERNPGSELDTLVREKTACYANFPIGERVTLHLRGNTIGFLTHLFQRQPQAQTQAQPQAPAQPQAQAIPQVLPIQQLAEQPDTDGEEEQSRENLEMPFQQDLCSSCNWNNFLGHATTYVCEHMPPSEPQAIPQVLPLQELAEQPDTDGEDEDDGQPKKPHNPIYTNRRWPSPIAKVFVQKIRGNNAWDNGRNIWWRSDGAWAPDFKVAWRSAGNSEFKLTHDNCMRYLAYRMGRISLSKLLEMEPKDVHAKLIGQFSGVPGFFTKRYAYY
jgi:hypothetical protein